MHIQLRLYAVIIGCAVSTISYRHVYIYIYIYDFTVTAHCENVHTHPRELSEGHTWDNFTMISFFNPKRYNVWPNLGLDKSVIHQPYAYFILTYFILTSTLFPDNQNGWAVSAQHWTLSSLIFYCLASWFSVNVSTVDEYLWLVMKMKISVMYQDVFEMAVVFPCMSWTFPSKLRSVKCQKTALMISQHCFRWWLVSW